MTGLAQLYVDDTNPIIEIQEKHPVLYIMWVIGTRCNFSCSYCPDVWHDKHSEHKTLEELQNAWKKIVEVTKDSTKPVLVGILGGEPTMNPNLLPFLQWVKLFYNPGKIDITVYSNGTASLEYYQQLSRVSSFCFSTHSEFFNESKFFSTVTSVNQFIIEKKLPRHLTVLVMDESWNKHKTDQYIQYLKDNNIDWLLSPVEPAWKPGTNYPVQKIRPPKGPKKTNKDNLHERITTRIV